MIREHLRSERRGVSPVIGVILMVAITVILASVVAVFALGIGTGPAPPSDVAWEFDYEDSDGADDTLTIRHAGGSQVDGSNLVVKVADPTVFTHPGENIPDKTWEFAWTGSDLDGDTSLTSADSATVDGSDFYSHSLWTVDFSTATVKLIWDPGNGQSQTLATWQGPQA